MLTVANEMEKFIMDPGNRRRLNNPSRSEQ